MNRHLRAFLTVMLFAATTLARADPVPPVPPNPVLPYSTVTASPSPILPGQYTTIRVDSGNYGGDGRLLLTYGDNSGGYGGWTWTGGCAPVYPNTPDTPIVVRHAYRYPGTYTIDYSYTFNCHGYDVPPSSPYHATTTVTVNPGPPAPSNGPERPFFNQGLGYFRPGEPGGTRDAFTFYTDPYDLDGYMTRLVYSWGDGTPDTVYPFSLSKCVDPPDHWPQTGNDDSDDPPAYEFATHKYARKGTYTATVTMTTTGCDGRHPQTARATTRVVVK